MPVTAALAVPVLALTGLALLGNGPARPQDRPVAMPSGHVFARPVRIAVLGTSLTAMYDWPEHLERRLDGCLDAGAVVTEHAEPGVSVGWGMAQLQAIVSLQPDVVLVEFAINDADVLDGVSLTRARRMTQALVRALQNKTDAAVVLMTMNPTYGPRGWLRLRLPAHYDAYRDIAAETDSGLVDLYPRWLAMPRRLQGLSRDGLHPDPEIQSAVIVPVLLTYLSDLLQIRCGAD